MNLTGIDRSECWNQIMDENGENIDIDRNIDVTVHPKAE